MLYLLPFFLIAIGSAFEHEQALHAKNFRGESQAFCTALWISVYASWAARIAILVYIVLNLSWVAAIAMFIGGMLASGVIAGLHQPLPYVRLVQWGKPMFRLQRS
jgi:hypothetical protein